MLYFSASGSAGSAGGSTEEEDAAEDASAASADSAEASEEVPILFGPEEIIVELDGGSTYLDLDSQPPLVTDSKIDGHDMLLSTTSGAPLLAAQNSTAFTLAPVPDNGETPSHGECVDHVETNGTYIGDFEEGAGFCLQTDEGRMAYFEITASLTGQGPAPLEMTVWE